MFSVHNPWDKLKTCIVGRSYPPEFYSFIQDSKVRSVMERIAIETEEDYQSLVDVLESYNVEVLRPNIGNLEDHIADDVLCMPPSTPRDYTAMVGDRFFIDRRPGIFPHYADIVNRIREQGNSVTLDQLVNTANVFFYDDRLICGDPEFTDADVWNAIRMDSWPLRIPQEHYGRLAASMIHNPKAAAAQQAKTRAHHANIARIFHERKCEFISGESHIDGCFCIVKPGLVVGIRDAFDYEKLFPGWDIVWLDDSMLSSKREFNILKNKNRGKWWVPGEEHNDQFTEFVDSYLNHWTGFVEETVFDVNMLMMDENTAVGTSFSDEMLAAFFRHSVTPIQVNFRHRYFWDGGIHCITSDINRG